MKSLIALFISFLALNGLSCSREDELDTAIDEALREADFDDRSLDEQVSIRYFEETRAR